MTDTPPDPRLITGEIMRRIQDMISPPGHVAVEHIIQDEISKALDPAVEYPDPHRYRLRAALLAAANNVEDIPLVKQLVRDALRETK